MQIGDNTYTLAGLFGTCGLILLALLAFWPAVNAFGKGRHFVAWYVFGFLALPVALAASYWVKPIKGKPEQTR